ncbi:hypothetical protein R4P71_31650 [Rhodococcus sp. IEGM 1304]|uniref:hypothetical protein n=1 Tax=Rhodococcus sp. IEGM 1304 TaxID=3082227 RepID=UPI002953EA6D|nr:hypothetical protein [Rhodococcus sp. IEGM 1304]MDV8129107.1 hypothetical protein [Rhodococcus sp. IEGM 1304]
MSRKNEIQIRVIALLAAVGLAFVAGIMIGTVFRPQTGSGGMEISIPDSLVIPDSIATWQIGLAFAAIPLVVAGLAAALRPWVRHKSETNIQRYKLARLKAEQREANANPNPTPIAQARRDHRRT